jgi:tetratricopeptide (TPR) repeat protein
VAQLKKTHYIALALAILVGAGLYALPRAVVKQRAAGADTAKAANRSGTGSTEMAQAEEPESQATDSTHALTTAQEIELATLRKASASSLKGLESAAKLASQFAKLGKFDSAARYRNMVATASPTEQNLMAVAEDWYHAFSVATAPEKAKDFASRAQKAYAYVLAINPKQLEAKTHLGMTYVAGPNPMQGVVMLRQVIAEDPDNEEALYSLGTLSMQSGQYDKAVARFEQILRAAPGNTRARFYLGVSLKELGRPAEARRELERVKREDADPAVQATVDDYLAQLTQS